jgi:hypothetical protein
VESFIDAPFAERAESEIVSRIFSALSRRRFGFGTVLVSYITDQALDPFHGLALVRIVRSHGPIPCREPGSRAGQPRRHV